jgi:hypothetical protein
VTSPNPLVDARALLSLTSELHQANNRVESAKVSVEQKDRWQRRLASIAEGASADLERAHGQLHRFVATLDRSL